MTRKLFISLLVVVSVVLTALLVGPSIAIGQPSSGNAIESAKKEMERGQGLYVQRKYAEAAKAFAAAYAIQPYAAFLYNEAVCHQKLGDNAKALELFHRYLTAVPNAPDAEKVRARIQRIEQATAPPPATDAGEGDGGVEASPPASDGGTTIVQEEGPDLMKSLVLIESDPPNAPVSIYFRTAPNVAAFNRAGSNPGWKKVVTGRTPVNATLEVGRYHVVMEPFADYHQSETDIDVAAGHIHQFKANLRQGEFMAFLRVTSPIPGARIYVDDPPPHKKPPWGRTPHEGLVGVGDHRIWIVKNGFQTSSRTFSVSHGEEREELVDLERIKKGIARFEGNAASIEVQVDGNPVGTFHPGSPIEVELSSGTHQVFASADGRKDLSMEFEVPRGQIQPIDLVMIPSTPRTAAWVQAVGSLAFLGGGFVLRKQSDKVYDAMTADQRGNTLTVADDRYNQGKIFAISSTACFGVSGALALWSGYNFIRDPTADSGLRPGRPLDYPDEPSAEPGAPSPSDRDYISTPPPKARRPASQPIFSDIAIVPARSQHGAALMLQGRF